MQLRRWQRRAFSLQPSAISGNRKGFLYWLRRAWKARSAKYKAQSAEGWMLAAWALFDRPQTPARLSHLSRMTYMSPLVFHPFFFVPTKKNGWSPKRKRPPISLCLIPVRKSGWPETRFAQTVGPEFPLLLTSIAPTGPARLRMGGELNGILKFVRRHAVSGAVMTNVIISDIEPDNTRNPRTWDCAPAVNVTHDSAPRR